VSWLFLSLFSPHFARFFLHPRHGEPPPELGPSPFHRPNAILDFPEYGCRGCYWHLFPLTISSLDCMHPYTAVAPPPLCPGNRNRALFFAGHAGRSPLLFSPSLILSFLPKSAPCPVLKLSVPARQRTSISYLVFPLGWPDFIPVLRLILILPADCLILRVQQGILPSGHLPSAPVPCLFLFFRQARRKVPFTSFNLTLSTLPLSLPYRFSQRRCKILPSCRSAVFAVVRKRPSSVEHLLYAAHSPTMPESSSFHYFLISAWLNFLISLSHTPHNHARSLSASDAPVRALEMNTKSYAP